MTLLTQHEQFNKNDDQGQEEHKQADPVDAMHVFHPPGIGRVRIALFYIEIFC